MKLSTSTARKLVLQAQGLTGGWELSPGKEGVVKAVERLGYVQIDAIAVVQRAHHHTLWSRCPDYTQEMLHELQATDRRVFEYWARAACYLPLCDYRCQYGYFCLPILWGPRFVGRIDAKTERKQRILTIKHLRFEPTFSDFDAVAAPLADKLVAFARFNACEQITVERCTPAKASLPVTRMIQCAM